MGLLGQTGRMRTSRPEVGDSALMPKEQIRVAILGYPAGDHASHQPVSHEEMAEAVAEGELVPQP